MVGVVVNCRGKLQLFFDIVFIFFCVIVYVCVVWCHLFVIEIFQCFVKMDKDHWMHDNIMSEKVDMNVENEDEPGVKLEHIDCSYAFNTSKVLKLIFVVKVN